MRFDGQTVIVTGGARNMGACHVEGFHAEGANVAIFDLEEEAGLALAALLGERAMFVKIDVSDRAAWTDAVAQVEARFGPVTALVNNAGIIPNGSVLDITPQQAERTLQVNILGCLYGLQATVPSMRKRGGGAIVNISSAAGMTGVANYAVYSSTKWALRGLGKAAAVELGQYGIRINSVHPGVIGNGQAVQSDVIMKIAAKYPIARPGTLDEVTKMVLFVASNDASYSTGQEFIIDGGQTAGIVTN